MQGTIDQRGNMVLCLPELEGPSGDSDVTEASLYSSSLSLSAKTPAPCKC